MRIKFFTCDVFTTERFGGNQLAVIPDATGLSDHQLQQVAGEFNYSESTFVFPAESGHTRKVRIFTPTVEVPFAGHPNIGTAFVLASTGELEDFTDSVEVAFEETAGIVPISIRRDNSNNLHCELKAPEQLTLGKSIPVEEVSSALSLRVADIVVNIHTPQVASVGLPFLMVELRDVQALTRIKVNLAGFDAIARCGVVPDLHAYVRSNDEFDVRSRIFAPLDGVLEDPATGSANCALAGLLAHHNDSPAGDFALRISQGVEMGRPSILKARAEKKGGEVINTWVGGSSVMVSDGFMTVD